MFLYGLLVAIHVLVSLFLVAVVLLQTGKRADLAGAFGGGGSQTAFGPRGGANFLSKATTISAALFMVTSLSLAILSSHRTVGGGGSVLDKVPAPTAPATPPSSPAPQGSAPSTTPPPPPAPEQQPQQPPSEK
jgi:preprotein translocase subunit SecG